MYDYMALSCCSMRFVVYGMRYPIALLQLVYWLYVLSTMDWNIM